MPDSTKLYTTFFLYIYDVFVLYFSTTFAWRCPTSTVLLPFFRQHVGRDVHMDVGVGTGYYPAHAADKLSKSKKLILVDLHPNTLRVTKKRLHEANFAGNVETLEHDIFEALPERFNGTVDSVSLFYLFHCLPGSFPAKAEQVVARLVPVLSPEGVVYGCTVLGAGVKHNWLGKALMRFYNSHGMFCNYGDTAEGLKKGLLAHFDEVDVRVVGRLGLFMAKKPRKE